VKLASFVVAVDLLIGGADSLTGSGVSRSSSDGLFGVLREWLEAVREARARDGASESEHCSTSTSTSSSPSA